MTAEPTSLPKAALPSKPGVRPFRARIRRYLGSWKVLPIALVAVLVVRHRLVTPIPARSYVVDRGDVTREVFGRATIESRREVQLGFDLVGRVTNVLVDEGDRVKLGQVVALAPDQLYADAQAASSGVPLARAAIARLVAEERRAQANLTFAQQEAARLRALAASGSLLEREVVEHARPRHARGRRQPVDERTARRRRRRAGRRRGRAPALAHRLRVPEAEPHPVPQRTPERRDRVRGRRTVHAAFARGRAPRLPRGRSSRARIPEDAQRRRTAARRDRAGAGERPLAHPR